MAKELYIRIDDSKQWNNTKVLWDYLRTLGNGKYKITISKADKRSLNQNSWFHSVLPLIKDGLRDAGFDEVRNEDDAKAVVKGLFFKKYVTNGVETIPIIEGTSEATKLDFASKADEIIKWAKDYLSIDVAPPGAQFEFFE